MQLSFHLLGAAQVLDGDRPITFESNAARALLVYLAVEANRPHRREALATLFWPDKPQTAAFANLRQSLARLRRAWPADAYPALDATQQTIQFNRGEDGGIRVDVAEFESLLAEVARHAHPDGTVCAACADRLGRAAALYRGEFLHGMSLKLSQPFEEWLLVRRERLHHQALHALHALAEYCESTGDIAQMRQHAARQIELEPLREEAYGQLMRALAYSGDRTAALAQYEACKRLLQAELGVEPWEELQALAERIRAGALERPTPAPAPAAPSFSSDWGDIPETGALFGRQGELDLLHQWLARDRCRLVWVFGIGGIGKTSLAAAASAAARAATPASAHPPREGGDQPFDAVIWQSLLNAPPIDEVLRAVLQTLSQHRSVELPPGLDQQLAVLLDLLRQARCLLVLDNLESILQADGDGTYRPGYESYDQLIQCFAQHGHKSCLLVTSREEPRETARLNGRDGVRALRLTGLAPEAAQAMLATLQLDDDPAEAANLARRYSGNPLALKLVAQTVQELFMGNIADFLSAEAPIFDDVRTVLDQQFERLTPLQLQIMTWLAIMREPVTLATLREALLNAPPSGEFLEALRALQRRSLLEQAHVHDSSAASLAVSGQPADRRSATFTLQNVIMEYVTDRLVGAIREDVESSGLRNLNQYSLLNVQAREYVRQSQLRLIVQPIAEQLMARLGTTGIERQFRRVLSALRQAAPRTPGYAAGNILNLMLHLGFDVAPYDFSRLCVWQADLRGVKQAPLNLAECDLSRSAFMLSLSVAAVRLDQAGAIHFAGVSEGALRLWEAKGGQLRNAVRLDRPVVGPIAYSADGRFLAHCSPDFVISVCAATDGAELRTLAGHAGRVIRLAFSADGSMLASCSWDGSVRVWDVHTGNVIHVLREQARAVTCLAFSPDGATLAGGGERRTIVLWDVRTGQVMQTLHGHLREVECCAFSPDGQTLASGSHDGEIRLWHVPGGRLQRAYLGHTHIVRALAFERAGGMLASSGANGSVRLWHAGSGQLIHDLVGHAFDVSQIAFSPDGRLLVSGSSDNTVRLWDTTTGYALDVLSGHSYLIRAARFNPDPDMPQLVIANAVGGIHMWDLRTHDIRTLRGDDYVVFDLAFTPDGRQFVSGGADGAVRVWDVLTGRCTHVLRGHIGSVKAVAIGANGRIMASGGTDRAIRLWRMGQTGAACSLSGHEDDVIGLAFDRTGYRLVSGSLDHTARVWDVQAEPDAQAIRADARGVLDAHAVALRSAKFTADGQLIATNTWNSEVFWWAAATGQRLDKQGGASLHGWGVVFSPDGKLMAIVSADGVEVRDYDTLHLRYLLRGHQEQVIVLDFDATSSRLVSCDWNGMVCLWDVHTGACLHRERIPGPYAGMNISGVTGISEAQKAALQVLGAVSDR